MRDVATQTEIVTFGAAQARTTAATSQVRSVDFSQLVSCDNFQELHVCQFWTKMRMISKQGTITTIRYRGRSQHRQLFTPSGVNFRPEDNTHEGLRRST
jgi:hypothetical protein